MRIIAVVLALLLSTIHSPNAQAAYKFTNIATQGPSSIISGYEIDGETVAIHGGMEIYTVTGGVKTTVVKTDDPAPVGTFGQSAFGTTGLMGLSDGAVSFFASYLGGAGIFSGSGGPLTTIAKTGEPVPMAQSPLCLH
jgi:hypothetical protein